MYAPEDEAEGDPPDKVVGDQGVEEAERDEAGGVVHQKAGGAEKFAEPADGYDRPMAHRIVARPPVAKAVDANDHAHPLPHHRMAHGLHADKLPEVLREENHPGTPEDVVDGRQAESGCHPGGRRRFLHCI